MKNPITHLLKILLILPILAFSSNLFAQDRTWQTFTPRTGGWSVLAPANLNPDAEALKQGSKQGSYVYNDSNGFFAVVYKDYSPLNFMFGRKSHFGKQRDTVIKANNGKLISDVEFTSGNLKGREVQIRMPDNRVIDRESNIKPSYRVQRFRMFFDSYRFYMILAVLPEADINAPAVTDYLNSFKLK
jgi:hypothetical protein